MHKKVNNFTFNSIDQESSLWRFMDFTKFADLVLSSKVFLCRVDSFEDNYEGYIGHLEYDVYKQMFADVGTQIGSNFDFISRLNNHVELITKLKKFAFANCWHMNNYESAAMWKLYAQTSEAIAIKTSLSRLERSLKDAGKVVNENEIYIDTVKYLDFSKLDTYPDGFAGQWLSSVFFKRFSFEHEKEVRVLYLDLELFSNQVEESNSKGILLDIDIKELIETVYISPDAPPWFFNMTKKFLHKVGLDQILCQQSELYSLK